MMIKANDINQQVVDTLLLEKPSSAMCGFEATHGFPRAPGMRRALLVAASYLQPVFLTVDMSS